MRDQEKLSPCCNGNPSVLSHGYSWMVGSFQSLTRTLQSLEGIASKSEFLEKWLYICFSTKQQPSTAGICSFIAAFGDLKWLCLLSLVRVGCKMSRDHVCPLQPWAESAPYAMEEGSLRAFMVQFHTTAEKCSPQGGWEDHFSQQPGLSALQLCFISASVHRCSSGFM